MKVWQRIRAMIGVGTLTQVDDTQNTQLLQAQFGYLQLHDKLIYVQHYGFASVPPVQSDVVAIFVGGDQSNGVAIGTNHQTLRPRNQKPGECQVYGPNNTSIALTQTGIVINCGGLPLTINNCPGINITGTSNTPNPTVSITGNIHTTGDVVAGTISLDTHRHTDPQGGVVGLPQ